MTPQSALGSNSLAGRLREGARELLYRFFERRDDWAVAIYSGSSPFTLAPRVGRPRLALTKRDVTDIRAEFVADPFLVRHAGKWYLFAEVLNATNQRGEICVAESDDGVCWCYKQIVLAEPFHLSYPNVFVWEGRHYMMPESPINQVLLYEATNFPYTWRREAVVLEGMPFSDATPFLYAGRWWMLVCSDNQRHDTLRLYMGDSPKGPWREHPASPLVQGDARIARPAGRVQQIDGKLYRFAQDDFLHYGHQVWAFEITELTPTHYAERPVGAGPVLAPAQWGWNTRGMHHIDPHQIADGSWIGAVDGYSGPFRLKRRG